MKGGRFLLVEKQRECRKEPGVGEADAAGEKNICKVVPVKARQVLQRNRGHWGFCHLDLGREGRKRN